MRCFLIFQAVQDFGIMMQLIFKIGRIITGNTGPYRSKCSDLCRIPVCRIWRSIDSNCLGNSTVVYNSLTVMHFINKFKESEILYAVLYGIRPATVGLIASALYF